MKENKKNSEIKIEIPSTEIDRSLIERYGHIRMIYPGVFTSNGKIIGIDEIPSSNYFGDI